jgi:hypothetical protein
VLSAALAISQSRANWGMMLNITSSTGSLEEKV